jgi:hypothetical protein
MAGDCKSSGFGHNRFDPYHLHQILRLWRNGSRKRLKISRLVRAGSSPASRTTYGSKVFMDARHTVTVEEWGSLPPRPAKPTLGPKEASGI